MNDRPRLHNSFDDHSLQAQKPPASTAAAVPGKSCLRHFVRRPVAAHVQFSTLVNDRYIVAYSVVYDQHPREFVFGRTGRRIPSYPKADDMYTRAVVKRATNFAGPDIFDGRVRGGALIARPLSSPSVIRSARAPAVARMGPSSNLRCG